MNPFIMAAIIGNLQLKRTCPKCMQDQVIPGKKRKQIVRCRFCGADVPPDKSRVLT